MSKHEAAMLFHRLHRAHKNTLQARLAAQGLTDIGQPMLLFMVKRGPHGQAQRAVAERLGVTPAAVAMSLKHLERQGYVARSADEQDARRKHVVLTEKGQKAIAICEATFASMDEMLFRGFSEAEQASLSGYLQRMLQNISGEKLTEGGNDICSND